MTKIKSIDIEKWTRNTALLFFQIFSVDYEQEVFLNKILSGGGGNSTLCSTWMHLNEFFINYRISETAYNLLLEKVANEDKNKISLKNNTVFISKKIYKNTTHSFFIMPKEQKIVLMLANFFILITIHLIKKSLNF